MSRSNLMKDIRQVVKHYIYFNVKPYGKLSVFYIITVMQSTCPLLVIALHSSRGSIQT
jgi:hypothetical protein